MKIFDLKNNKKWLVLIMAIFFTVVPDVSGAQKDKHVDSPKRVFQTLGNPYLPLWEHVPDGEPRVFEDPDKPGKYRIYIISNCSKLILQI